MLKLKKTAERKDKMVAKSPVKSCAKNNINFLQEKAKFAASRDRENKGLRD